MGRQPTSGDQPAHTRHAQRWQRKGACRGTLTTPQAAGPREPARHARAGDRAACAKASRAAGAPRLHLALGVALDAKAGLGAQQVRAAVRAVGAAQRRRALARAVVQRVLAVHAHVRGRRARVQVALVQHRAVLQRAGDRQRHRGAARPPGAGRRLSRRPPRRAGPRQPRAEAEAPFTRGPASAAPRAAARCAGRSHARPGCALARGADRLWGPACPGALACQPKARTGREHSGATRQLCAKRLVYLCKPSASAAACRQGA